jgi:hypothetical protein
MRPKIHRSLPAAASETEEFQCFPVLDSISEEPDKYGYRIEYTQQESTIPKSQADARSTTVLAGSALPTATEHLRRQPVPESISSGLQFLRESCSGDVKIRQFPHHNPL